MNADMATELAHHLHYKSSMELKNTLYFYSCLHLTLREKDEEKLMSLHTNAILHNAE